MNARYESTERERQYARDNEMRAHCEMMLYGDGSMRNDDVVQGYEAKLGPGHAIFIVDCEVSAGPIKHFICVYQYFQPQRDAA